MRRQQAIRQGPATEKKMDRNRLYDLFSRRGEQSTSRHWAHARALNGEDSRQRTQWRCDSGAYPTSISSWLSASWLTVRQRPGSPGSARPGAAAPSLYLVYLVYLVCLV